MASIPLDHWTTSEGLIIHITLAFPSLQFNFIQVGRRSPSTRHLVVLFVDCFIVVSYIGQEIRIILFKVRYFSFMVQSRVQSLA